MGAIQGALGFEVGSFAGIFSSSDARRAHGIYPQFGVICATIEEPFLIRRSTCLSFSARRASLRATWVLIAQASRSTI
jgi:hypothetical protein